MTESIVSDNERGRRLDVFVAGKMPQLSRAFIQKLCDGGKITVNGSQVKAGYKLKTGDKVKVDYDLKQLAEVPKIKLPIIYEDEDCIAIDKPAGVLVHSKGDYNAEATVATWLRNHITKNQTVINSPLYKDSLYINRAGIVHRLDRATSGVMICAKTSEALSWLQKQFSQRKVKKTYVAIVQGSLRESEAVIDMPIERNPKAPATFRVGPNGKSATTHYKVLQANNRYSLLELSPTTGRTHQLRVHLAQLGHPIVGDTLYGGQPAERLFLHARELEITLPNRERKTFESQLPAAFQRTME